MYGMYYLNVLLIRAMITVAQPHEYAMSIAEHRCATVSIVALRCSAMQSKI